MPFPYGPKTRAVIMPVNTPAAWMTIRMPNVSTLLRGRSLNLPLVGIFARRRSRFLNYTMERLIPPSTLLCREKGLSIVAFVSRLCDFPPVSEASKIWIQAASSRHNRRNDEGHSPLVLIARKPRSRLRYHRGTMKSRCNKRVGSLRFGSES